AATAGTGCRAGKQRAVPGRLVEAVQRPDPGRLDPARGGEQPRPAHRGGAPARIAGAAQWCEVRSAADDRHRPELHAQPRPAAGLHRSAHHRHHLPGRLRRVVGAGPVRRRAPFGRGQLRLDIARRDIDNQRQTVHLTEVRQQLGAGSEQDVASAKARLSAVQAQLPVLQTAVSASEFRLAVLLGERPGELDIDLSPKSFTPIAANLPIGDAGDVLSRRPDVQMAEREYAAATARIGVAKADFFPHITLGGFLGFLSGRSNDFGSPSTRAWSLMPSISWPGLNVQRVRANLHASEARADAAQANYQQTVLLAIEDIDNAVTGFNQQ